MIGGGLALNDRVYTGSGNVPYVQFESVGDFIPEPRCLKFAVGLQMEGRKIEGTRGPVELWSEGPRVRVLRYELGV